MDELLAQRLFAAYRKGLTRRSPPLPWETRTRPFDFLFRQAFWLRIPVRERVPIARVWRGGSEGLRLSREGRFDEAREKFQNCEEELARAAISPQGSLLARAPLASHKAYFECKRGDFALARALILDAMEADLQLEDDDLFKLLEMHRLQLVQNLVRIELRGGDARLALGLAGHILAYAEGLVDELPVHHSWQGEKLLAAIPRSLRRALISQVANEAVQALYYFPQSSLEEELFAGVRIESYHGRAPVLHEPFRTWLLAKQAFHRREWTRYPELLLSFLPAGRGDLQAVWYAAMVDVLAFCRASEDPIAMSLHDRILQDVKRWPRVPLPLRPMLGLEGP